MRTYQFHFLDGQGRRPALDFDQCPDDDEAARSALFQLRQHRSCRGVEVYEADRLVAVVTCPEAGSGAASAR